MSDQDYYFSQLDRVAFRDYAQMNRSLEEHHAGFQYGPAFDADGMSFWNDNTVGIYRLKDSFTDPAQATASLAEAFQRELVARFNYSAYSPSEPKLPAEYHL